MRTKRPPDPRTEGLPNRSPGGKPSLHSHHGGVTEAADLIVKGIEGTITANTVTCESEVLLGEAKLLKCSEFGEAIVKQMG